MAYENNDKKMESVYSQRIRAGKRRTYFFDVRETRGNDYYLTITESRKKFNEDGYDRHKIFLYKEDFNKFLKGMTEAIDFVKTDLMPDFDFDAFNHDNDSYEGSGNASQQKKEEPESIKPEEKVDEAPTGIAAAATPEIEPEVEQNQGNQTPPPATSSHKDEEVDKW
ncbi:MAG: DUF3276 family protein [Ginsengibacter sp.]